MAISDFTVSAQDEAAFKYSIITNSGGERVFRKLADVYDFGRTTAAHVASLLAVIESADADCCIEAPSYEAVTDLAFQLQQAVAIMAEAVDASLLHEIDASLLRS